MASKHTTVVMTGDPKQLGPRFQNRSVKHHELSRSIMERMATLPAYQNSPPDHHLHPSSVKQPFPHERLHTVHLVENYRSHRLILQFPSQQFYGGTLRSAADPAVVDSLLGWCGLPNPNFPILFKSVEGEDIRETDSPSFFNPQEVAVVSELVVDLLSSHKESLDEKDVGIIAPFYKQVQKIRLALRQCGLRRVTVASIEEMQGKEFKAIFISTTRASLKHRDYDFRHGLGFPHEGRSLNTAITRAVALLVVVGDAYILSQDKHWKALINYCVENGSYVGEPITPQYSEQRKLKEANKLNEPVLVLETSSKNPEPKQNIPEPPFENPSSYPPPNNLFPPNNQDYSIYPPSLQYSSNWPPSKPYTPILPPSPSPPYAERPSHPSSRNYLSICKYRNSHQFIAVEERFLVPTIAILDNQNSLDIQIGKFCYSCHVTRSGQLIYVDLVKNPGQAIWHSPLTVSETHLLIQVPDDYFGHPIDILESNALLYIKLSKHLTHAVQSIPVNDSLVKSMSLVNQHPTNLELYPTADAPPPNISANYYNPPPPSRNNNSNNSKHNNLLYLPSSSSWYNPPYKPRPPKQH